MSIRSKILGVGSYLPPRVVTNNDLTKMMDTSDEWIQQRSGIKQRHWVDEGMPVSFLAHEAANKAFESAGVQKGEIDLILLATICPDHEFPGAACFLQGRLDLPGIPAIDVRQQCSGFIYALSMADKYIRSGEHKKVLVVGSEVHSTGLDKTTEGRDTAVLFGDGAGAVILGAYDSSDAATESCMLSTHLHADGSFAKELWVAAPGSAHFPARMSQNLIDDRSIYPYMNGKSVFVNASKKMPEAIMEAVQANDVKLEDIDLFLFHQANLRINEMVGKQLKIPPEKIFNTIDRFGNTTAATIPLGMDYAVKEGKLKPGMLVASAAFGSGFTWASALYRW